MSRRRHARPALRGIVTAVLTLVAVLSAGQPPVARADGNQIVLAADRYVGAKITDGGHLNTLALSIVAPLSGTLGAETNFGTTRFPAGTEFVFQLDDAGPLGGGGTFLSTDPAHARVTQTGPDTWRIGWDDAYGDGDFDDLYLDVTGSRFRIHQGQQFGVGDPIHAVWPGTLRSDPVNTANGSFVHSATDASLPGAGLPFRFTRTYNSADPSGGPLGAGWSINVTAAALAQGNGDVIVRAEDGQQLYFRAQGDGTYAGGDGIHSSLSSVPGGGWQLTRKDELTYQFDPAGRVVEVADHNANQLGFRYDPDGRLVTVTDTAGRVISLAYDTGMLASLTLPDERTVTYSYTSGRLTSVTDPAGATTTYTYDGAGRLATIVDANGHTQVANTYGSDGRLTAQVDALGHRSTLAWNAGTSTATFTDAAGHVTKDVYDPSGILLSTVDPLGKTASYGYDNDVHLTDVVDEAGTSWETQYDADGDLLDVQGPLGFHATAAYDAGHRPTTVTDATGRATTYAYDEDGNLTTITRPGGVVTTFTYTPSGQPASVSDSAGTTTFTYDAAGNLTQANDPTGGVTTYTYDTAGRLLTTVTPAGNVAGGDPDAHRSTYAYDAADRLVSTTDPAGGVTTHSYDQAGNRTSTTDPDGHTTTFAYDAANQLVSVTAPDGGITTYGYDEVGNRTSRTDPLGRTTTFTWDGLRRLTGETNPAGEHTASTYDPLGRLLTMTDPAGKTTTFTYDALGRRTSETHPTGATTTFTWDLAGRLLSRTDPAGALTTYTYDPAGHLAGVTDPAGKTTISTYDAGGRLASRTDPTGATTTFAYDPAGRLAASVDPLGNAPGGTPAAHRTTYGYDPDGNLTSVTDPLGHVTGYLYDALGRPKEMSDANGRATRYGYDPAGNLATVTAADGTLTRYGYDPAGRRTTRLDARGHATAWAWDRAGQLTSRTAPLGGRWSWTYDAAGRLASAVDPAGNATAAVGDGTTTYAYDPRGLLTLVHRSDQTTYSFEELSAVANVTYTAPLPDVRFTYDDAGRPVTMDDGTGVVETSAYDVTGRLTDVVRGLDRFHYDYDLRGLVTRRASPDSSALDYAYDDAGRLTDATRAGQTTTYVYDAAGRPIGRSLPNGQVETRTFDAAGRLVAQHTARAGVTLEDRASTLDAAGDPTATTGPEGTTTYGYDPLRRLTSACFAPPCGGALGDWVTYSYDAVGNRTAETRRTGVTSFSYDPDDRLTTQTSPTGTVTSYAYDPAGNQIAAGGRRYAYDPAGRQALVAEGLRTTRYTYDGHGSRIRSAAGVLGLLETEATTTTSTVWDRQLAVPSPALERDHQRNVTARYSWAGDDLISVAAGGAEHYYHRDRLGSVTAVTAANGTPEWAYSYEPFGTARRATKLAGTAPTNPLRFAGEHLDAETGLYHLRARHYDPALGRFTAPDPLDAPGDRPYVSAYAYADNQPTVLIDPLGLRPCRSTPSGLWALGEFVCEHHQGITQVLTGVAAAGLLAAGGGLVIGIAEACGLTIICGATVLGGLLPLGKPAIDEMVSVEGLAIEETAAAELTTIETLTSHETAVATEGASEAGYVASKIDITEPGLEHVFERHLADGALSAGKSVFYDNVTIIRLIADADSVAPVTQANGNLAWTVDAGRMIGIDRATGAATSIYTVITRAGGQLVTAFPGMP